MLRNHIAGILDKLSQFIGEINPYIKDDKTVVMEDMVLPDRPITYGIVKPGTNVEGGVPVVRVKDFTDGVIHTEDMLHTKPELNNKYLRSTLNEGDVLLSIGGTIGRVAIVPEVLVGANLGAVASVSPSDKSTVPVT